MQEEDNITLVGTIEIISNDGEFTHIGIIAEDIEFKTKWHKLNRNIEPPAFDYGEDGLQHLHGDS